MNCSNIIELEILEDETNMELNVEFQGDIIRLGGGENFIETDPTVPDWAKQPNPPTVDQSFNAASINAQSGIAIDAELQERLKLYIRDDHFYVGSFKNLFDIFDAETIPPRSQICRITAMHGFGNEGMYGTTVPKGDYLAFRGYANWDNTDMVGLWCCTTNSLYSVNRTPKDDDGYDYKVKSQNAIIRELTSSISNKLNVIHIKAEPTEGDELSKTALTSDGIIFIDCSGQTDYIIMHQHNESGWHHQTKFIFGRYNSVMDGGIYWRNYNPTEDTWSEWNSFVDSELDIESENPVMNKVIAEALQNTITVKNMITVVNHEYLDDAYNQGYGLVCFDVSDSSGFLPLGKYQALRYHNPTNYNGYLITNIDTGAVYRHRLGSEYCKLLFDPTAIEDNITIDAELDSDSENPIMNKAVAKAVEELNSKVGGGSGATESLVFEHNIENHSARVVTAIDFENFTMTLDDVSGIPTDTSGKAQNYIQLELFGGNIVKANVMPIELITKPFKVQSIGDNKVKLLDNSNNVIQFTDTGNIDVTKFKLCVNEKPFSAVNVNNLDTTHKYRIELDFNGFHHFTAGIKLPEMTPDSNGGYIINGIASRPNFNSVFPCQFNNYSDTISLRNITEGTGIGATSSLPVKFMVVLTPELYEGRKRTLVQIEITWFGYHTTKYNLINSVAYATGWANNAITQLGVGSGNLGWLGKAKLKVYDCGEVEL